MYVFKIFIYTRMLKSKESKVHPLKKEQYKLYKFNCISILYYLKKINTVDVHVHLIIIM